MPFLRILPVVVVGILIADTMQAPFWLTVSLLVVSFSLAVVFLRRKWGFVPAAMSLLFFSMAMTGITATREVMPKDEKSIAVLHIADNPQISGRWIRATAIVERYRPAEDGYILPAADSNSNDIGQSSGDSNSPVGTGGNNIPAGTGGAEENSLWRKSGEKVILRIDTAQFIAVGGKFENLYNIANDKRHESLHHITAGDKHENQRSIAAGDEEPKNMRRTPVEAKPYPEYSITAEDMPYSAYSIVAGDKPYSECSIAAGDRLVTEIRLAPVADSTYAGYLRLMTRRGYSASAWVYADYQTVKLPGKAKTPVYYASQMQAAAGERLDRLAVGEDALAVVKAMGIGSRESITPELREQYSLSGTSHLLAVSGLHVGIVAMLINLLLWPVAALRRGHLIKNIVAIAVIWLYAMITGLSPSALRAAMMLSGVQIAMFSSRKGGGMNALLGTATVMLLINPNYLYDVSFQLSFVAVLGIFLLYRPLYDMVRTRWKPVNALWSVILIGVTATLFTAPLVSYYFGRMPVIGIFLNPVVILTANIIVLVSVVWIIAPLPFLNGLFSSVLDFAGGLQNSIVEFSSTKSWASVSISLTLQQVLLVYLIGALIIYIVGASIRAKAGKQKATWPET